MVSSEEAINNDVFKLILSLKMQSFVTKKEMFSKSHFRKFTSVVCFMQFLLRKEAIRLVLFFFLSGNFKDKQVKSKS